MGTKTHYYVIHTGQREIETKPKKKKKTVKFILFYPWALTGVIHHVEKVEPAGISQKKKDCQCIFILHEQIKTSLNAWTVSSLGLGYKNCFYAKKCLTSGLATFVLTTDTKTMIRTKFVDN